MSVRTVQTIVYPQCFSGHLLRHQGTCMYHSRPYVTFIVIQRRLTPCAQSIWILHLDPSRFI
eukprot:scaffold307220_cov37-Tisochrysis_lutea.AAC.2